jgi:hypothetical protein
MKSAALNPVSRLVNVNNYMKRQLGLKLNYFDNDYDELINSLRNINASDERAWLWQQCTEFARFTTTDYNQNAFGSKVQLNYFVNKCTDVFGANFNISRVDAFLRTQNTQYTGTNTIIVNGNIDPWSSLGVEEVNSNADVINLNESAHCADFQPISNRDSVELTSARQKIADKLLVWKVNGEFIELGKFYSKSRGLRQF